MGLSATVPSAAFLPVTAILSLPSALISINWNSNSPSTRSRPLSFLLTLIWSVTVLGAGPTP